MHLNPALAITAVCISASVWIERKVDNLVHEAPACWLKSAKDLATHSPSASIVWRAAKSDGVITMDEVRKITAASNQDDVAEYERKRIGLVKPATDIKVRSSPTSHEGSMLVRDSDS